MSNENQRPSDAEAEDAAWRLELTGQPMRADVVRRLLAHVKRLEANQLNELTAEDYRQQLRSSDESQERWFRMYTETNELRKEAVSNATYNANGWTKANERIAELEAEIAARDKNIEQRRQAHIELEAQLSEWEMAKPFLVTLNAYEEIAAQRDQLRAQLAEQQKFADIRRKAHERTLDTTDAKTEGGK